LRIGVTGHRQDKLLLSELARIESSIREIFVQMKVSLEQVGRDNLEVFSDSPAHLCLVSALADGADSFFATAALEAGWQIDVCLPFPREQYAQDFTSTSRLNSFNALLTQAKSVFELPGNRSDSPAAYEAAGRLILDQSDILVAVWDEIPNRGRGGTSRVVAEAIARNIPVVHIHAIRREAPQLVWSGLGESEIEYPTFDSLPRAACQQLLATVVAALTLPPVNSVDIRMLRRFYVERAATSTPALPYPLLLAVTGVRALSLRDFRPSQALTSAAALRDLLDSGSSAGHDASERNAQFFAEQLIQRYGVADTAASYFAQVFRSGFVANFALAALAVILALAGLLVPALKLPIILSELVCVVLILLNTHGGRRFGWHERWMDNRHFAEQLRGLAFTSLLGDLGLRTQSRHQTNDGYAAPGWVTWLTRATAREIGFPTVNVDTSYLAQMRTKVQILINEQIKYQFQNAERMKKLDHRLHATGQVLFGGTLLACVLWIIAKLIGAPMGNVGTVGVTEIVTFLTAALPALGASIYGIRMQGDFAGIAFRSQTTVARLERLSRLMSQDSLTYGKLSNRLRKLNDIMLSDLLNWRTTYQARPLTLPS
jgi:hypothetical protein